MEHLVVEGGFAEPVMQAQQGFKSLMDALANPGRVQPLSFDVAPPAPLTRELAAIALTMCDHDSSVWLDPSLVESDAVVAWLRFHTGAPIVTEPREAQFALIADLSAMPQLNRFALGTDEYPDRSTTVAVMLPSLEGGAPLKLKGPGIRAEAFVSPAGLGAEFLAQWAENRAQFPRGVDLLLVAGGKVLGLPRTTRIFVGEQ
jgi:alpha-D-ribose 1-methylphosphonate 5-triphosphate synthase subunit PhnH